MIEAMTVLSAAFLGFIAGHLWAVKRKVVEVHHHDAEVRRDDLQSLNLRLNEQMSRAQYMNRVGHIN